MKKIKLISSAKLTALSMGLLLAVFCVLGMSFTPYEEAEEGASGPRKSHYHKDKTSCDTEVNHGALDYAEATAVTTGGGTVTISSPSGGGTVTSGDNTTSGANNGDQVVLKWNCGSTANNANNTTEAAHKRVIRFVATPDENHSFAGWSKDGTEAQIEAEGTPYDEEMFIDDWNQNNGSHESEAKALKLKYYAVFKEKKNVTVTFAVAEGGTYTYDCPEGHGSVETAAGSVTTSNAITLSATPAAGYKFFGWYALNGNKEEFFSTTQSGLSKAFYDNVTVAAKFIPSDAVIFTVKGTDDVYYDLNQAANAAKSSSSKVVVPTANGVLYEGEYTIPSGVTLLIPFDAGYTVYTTQPSDIQNKAEGQVTTAYRKLTMKSGAKIIVANGGAISLGAKMCAASGGAAGSGSVNGQYGCIDMLGTSQIEIQNGGNLYVWGYIYSSDCVETIDGAKQLNYQSSVVAKSGATVYEAFQMGDNHGGTCLSNTYSKVFVTNQYFIQNIEVPLTLESGATEKVFGSMYIRGNQNTSATFIGSGGLFSMNSGSYVRKYFDPIKDRQVFDLYGTATMSSITVKASVGSISSSSYVLPLTNNMTINILSGSNATLSYSASMLPGLEINIEENATCNVSGSLFAYDADEWCISGVKYGMLGWTKPLKFSAYNGNSNNTIRNTYMATTKLPDAKLMVNGTLNVNGYLITTSSGANICSEGNGQIYFKNGGSKGDKVLYQVNGTSSDVTTISSTTPAKLKHADGTYLETSGAAANTTITYANGHWGWKGIWEWNEGETAKSHSAIAVDTASLENQKPTGVTPTKEQTTEEVFSFNGNWTVKETIEENQEIIYEPQFNAKPRPYTITWKDGKDRVIDTTQVEYGLKPAYNKVEMIVIVKDEKPYRASFNGGWSTTNDNTPDEVIDVNGEATYYACYDLKLILNVGEVPEEETAPHQEVEETQVDTQESLTVEENVTMAKTNVGNSGSLTITEGATLESGVTNVTEGGEMAVTAGASVITATTTVTTGGAVTIDNSNVTSTTTNVTGGAVAVSNEATLVTENLSVQNQGEVVVDNATVTTQNLDVQENSKVTIKNGATVNASTEGNDVVNPTTIAAGAEVEVEEGASFHTDEITLNVMQEPVIQVNDQNNEAPEINHNASQVSGNGEVTVKKAYFDFTHKDGFRARTWYAVAVPWEISIPAYENGGVYAKKNDAYVPMQLGSHFDLIHYNGAARAHYGNNPETYWYCWRYVEDDIAAGQPAVMTPGKLYMIYLAEATDVIRFEKMEDAAFHYAGEVQTESNYSSDAADANWNGIANPNTYTSDMTYDDAEVGQTYVVTLDAEGNPFGTYVVVDLSKIYVGLPVFVQTTSQPVVKNQAPKRHMLKAQAEVAPKIEVQIAPIGLTYSDRIFLQTENGKADTYVIGADVAKAGVSTRFAQMWVNRYDNKLCYNTVAPVNNSAYYPLGISIVRAGDYTISVPAENLNDKVYLTYDNRIIWDLSVAPYELSIEQGVNTRYGIRIIRNNAPAVATDIENVSGEEQENGVQKVLMNNQVYVLREGVLYTITGQKAQ